MIAAEGYGLGLVGGLSVALCFVFPSLRSLFVFLALLSLFHMTEFLFAAVYHWQTCSTEAYLIPHSTSYTVAMLFSVTEYLLWWLIFGTSFIQALPVFWIGLFICGGGQLLRWAAFVTAGHNFTHLVAEVKVDKHHLVTDGIYGYIRHPGYCGWFWWSVGTQIMLGNPISIVGFAYASYKFFAARIPEEEELLESEDFFGEEYTRYKRTVPTYIPFIQ